MKLRFFLMACALSAAGLATAAYAEPPLIPYSGTGERVSPYYPHGSYYYDPSRYFYAPRVVFATPQERYPKFYALPGAGEERTAGPRPATVVPEVRAYAQRAKINVRVPTEAEVSVQGVKVPSRQTDLRVYLTEPLEPGRNYFYVVRARWSYGSLSYQQSDIVDIRAGETVDVDFMSRVPKDPTFVP